MYYILVETNEGQFYQETERGTTTRYTDLEGNTVPNLGPNRLVNTDPIQPNWALDDTPIEIAVFPRVITRLAFRNRFTLEEKTLIYTAADSEIAIKIWLDDLTNSEYVDLTDNATINSVTALVLMGMLTEARKYEILNA